MNTKIYLVLLLFTFMVMSIPALAQPGAPPATPIDGGLSLLLAAGGAYGIKKMKDLRNK